MAKKEKPSLVRALEFVALAQRDTGAPYQTHVHLGRNCAVAFDGVLAAGHTIDEDITACPHTFTLLAALRRATGVLSVAQLDAGRLSVKAGKFKAFVACMPSAVLQSVGPDPMLGVADNRLRAALAALAPFIAENSPRVVMASAYLRAGTAVATNGHVLLEYWHGIDMPPQGFIVPKLFINALCKIDKNITGFGFSDTSLTVYFEDSSWLRTQLYKDRWPDTDAVMARPHRANPLPTGFFEGLNNVFDFIEDNRVRIAPGAIRSHKDANVGASYEVSGVDATVTLNAKDWKLLDGLISSVDLAGADGISYFYGENLRGAMTQFKED